MGKNFFNLVWENSFNPFGHKFFGRVFTRAPPCLSLAEALPDPLSQGFSLSYPGLSLAEDIVQRGCRSADIQLKTGVEKRVLKMRHNF